jgi:hypothetical protein
MACGELLDRVKRSGELKHGQWLAWVKDNLEFSDRTAQVYIRLWIHREAIAKRLKAKPQTAADLTIEAAQDLISLSTGMSRTGSGFRVKPEVRDAFHQMALKRKDEPPEDGLRIAHEHSREEYLEQLSHVIQFVWQFLDEFKDHPGNAGFADVRQQLVTAISQLEAQCDDD